MCFSVRRSLENGALFKISNILRSHDANKEQSMKKKQRFSYLYLEVDVEEFASKKHKILLFSF